MWAARAISVISAALTERKHSQPAQNWQVHVLADPCAHACCLAEDASYGMGGGGFGMGGYGAYGQMQGACSSGQVHGAVLLRWRERSKCYFISPSTALFIALDPVPFAFFLSAW
jgi:hypothetical protein